MLFDQLLDEHNLIVQGMEMQPKLCHLPSVKGGGRGGALTISTTVAIVCHWARDQVTLDVAMFDESHNRYV